MPSFASNTVHGLSADVYFNASGASPVPVRVFGEVVVAISQEALPLTANDEGNLNPVDTLRRGETVTVTVPLADSSGLATISGVMLPFATQISGISGLSLMLPKAVPGDSFLARSKELRLVLRDGSATWVFPKAVVTEIQDLTLSEENQTVWGAVFSCYRATISGVETPFRIYSGSIVSGGY